MYCRGRPTPTPRRPCALVLRSACVPADPTRAAVEGRARVICTNRYLSLRCLCVSLCCAVRVSLCCALCRASWWCLGPVVFVSAIASVVSNPPPRRGVVGVSVGQSLRRTCFTRVTRSCRNAVHPHLLYLTPPPPLASLHQRSLPLSSVCRPPQRLLPPSLSLALLLALHSSFPLYPRCSVCCVPCVVFCRCRFPSLRAARVERGLCVAAE
jgi:hypothetical protein